MFFSNSVVASDRHWRLRQNYHLILSDKTVFSGCLPDILYLIIALTCLGAENCYTQTNHVILITDEFKSLSFSNIYNIL